MSYQTADLETLHTVKYSKSSADRLNHHCASSFGSGLNITDVHLYEKCLHFNFKGGGDVKQL